MSDFGSHRGISVTKACLPFPEGLGQRRRGGAAVGGRWTGVDWSSGNPGSGPACVCDQQLVCVLLGWIRKWDGRIKCLSEVRILHLLARKTEPPFTMGRVQVPNPEDQFHQDRAGLQCQRQTCPQTVDGIGRGTPWGWWRDWTALCAKAFLTPGEGAGTGALDWP